jgi:alkylation response protein AidB-like acyl-CoA dehydrogenase
VNLLERLGFWTGADGAQPVRTLVRDVVDRYVTPIVADLDATERFPAEVYDELARAGLFGVTVPARFGGGGGRAVDYLWVMEGLGHGYASIADQVGLVELVGSLLARLGTGAQRDRYLTPLLRARLRCAYALTEPAAGSDLRAVATRAVPDGDGWRLSGEKVYIHNAPVADVALVLARTGDAGLSTFLVDLDRDGVSRPYREHKMGQRASQVGGLRFEDVRLAPDALLGEVGHGFAYVSAALAKGRLGIAGLSLGVARSAIEAAMVHAGSRVAFGRPIGAHEAIGFRLADAVVEYRAATLLAVTAAQALDSAGVDTGAAAVDCSMAKLYASEHALRAADLAVQVFGGAGYIRGGVAERVYRDARITTIYEGTSEIQRLIISRALLPVGAARAA